MSWLVFISTVRWTIRIVMVAIILRRRFAPATALAWLTLIFFLPELGLVVYLLVGVSYLGRHRARMHRRVVGAAQSETRAAAMRPHAMRPKIAAEQRGMILQAERISGNPIIGGNHVELLPGQGDKIDRLVADIDAAEHHVHLLYYMYWPDEMGRRVADALERAQRRGAECRVLADATGSRAFFRSALVQQLKRCGVAVYAALPVALWRRPLARIDLRNHRKIAIIDGKVAYAGSHNIVAENYGVRLAGRWVDLSGRFTGPVVAQLQMVFLDDWVFETGQHLDGAELFPSLTPAGQIAAQVVSTGPSQEGETFRRVLVAALGAAQRRIIITTPYLVPDEPTMLALSMASDRGVEVDIVVPLRSDHPFVTIAGRSYFEPLIESGINIHQYRSGMLHTKTITVDDAFSLLGSANVDIRSFYLNFEINVLLYGPQITNLLRSVQQRYLSESQMIDLDQWRRRPLSRKYLESAAALFSPLL